MAQIVTLIKFKVKITQFQKKGYSSHYKGIVLIIKRFREIHESVLKRRMSDDYFGKDYLSTDLQNSAKDIVLIAS